MTESRERIFLVVVDNSPEVGVAVLYACLRAAKTDGRVALFHAIEPDDHGGFVFGHWMGVGDAMQTEAREEAEATLAVVSQRVQSLSGKMPLYFLREGDRAKELVKLLETEKSISVLVLAASPKASGPGPLVSFMAGKYASKLHIPLTIVPGTLSREELDAIT